MGGETKQKQKSTTFERLLGKDGQGRDKELICFLFFNWLLFQSLLLLSLAHNYTKHSFTIVLLISILFSYLIAIDGNTFANHTLNESLFGGHNLQNRLSIIKLSQPDSCTFNLNEHKTPTAIESDFWALFQPTRWRIPIWYYVERLSGRYQCKQSKGDYPDTRTKVSMKASVRLIRGPCAKVCNW